MHTIQRRKGERSFKVQLWVCEITKESALTNSKTVKIDQNFGEKINTDQLIVFKIINSCKGRECQVSFAQFVVFSKFVRLWM